MEQRSRFCIACIFCLSVLASEPVRAADWPTWRYDAARSAASPEVLPEELRLQWTRRLPPVQVAWPNEPRLQFDASHEPVVLGKMLFLGSPNDGSVAAFDTETGEEKWRFYTEGPVRFAPVAWQGRICFGSDDGNVYCLHAEGGSLAWQFRVAPPDRPDRRHLGNGRLISFWPVRGGPVLVDNTIYLAAGVWPTLGVFVAALDAETGRLKWMNREVSLLKDVRIDHNQLHDVGLSPQGYLVVGGGRLLVPNGRSMPAILDPETGKLLHYLQGYRNGDCRVIAGGKYALVGLSGVVDIATGREVGSRWEEAVGKPFSAKTMDLCEGPIFPYKLFPGCDAWSVLIPGMAYGCSAGFFYAYDLDHTVISLYEKDSQGEKLRPRRWDAPLVWKLASEHTKKKPESTALIKAGDRLYGHAGKVLLALDLPPKGGQPKVAWQKDLDGTPSSLVAADGKLFVATKEGEILAFGSGSDNPPTYDAPMKAADESRNEWSEAAAAALKQTSVTNGFCLVLGIKTGGLVEEILRQSALRVIAVDSDPEKIRLLRNRLAAAGTYGPRAELFVGKPFEFPFPPYLAGLIVSEDLENAGFSFDRPAGRLFGVLRPYGGVACLAVPGRQRDAFREWAASGQIENASVEQAGDLMLLRRAGPLPESAWWTHETADAARSYFSRDRRVKAPLGILWYGDGIGHGFYERNDYDTGLKPQVIGGRLFAFQVPTQTLFAYDVYTGCFLWKRKLERFTRYASQEDGIYAAMGGKCVALDPATGEERASFPYATEKPPVVKDIRVSDRIILIAVSAVPAATIEKGLWDSTALVALDRQTGKPLWKREAKERFNNNAVAMGGGMVFCADSRSAVEGDKAGRRGEKIESAPSTILALDERTGVTKWEVERVNPYRTFTAASWLGVRGYDDWLAYAEGMGLLLAGKSGNAYAFDAETGRQVWQDKVGGPPMIVRGKTFINQGGGLFDTATGKPLSKTALFKKGGGCNYAVASEDLVLLRDHTAAYVDIASATTYHLLNARSGCSNSLIAADGLLNAPNFAVGCVCNYPVQTSFAMIHMPEVVDWERAAR